MPFQQGYITLDRQYVEQLAVRIIDFSDPADKARHDRIVSLVERMLELYKQSPRTPGEKEGIGAGNRVHGWEDR